VFNDLCSANFYKPKVFPAAISNSIEGKKINEALETESDKTDVSTRSSLQQL